MRFKQLAVLLILLLILPLFLNLNLNAKAETTQASSSPLYFGVDVAYGSLAETEQLIDNVSSYTNFFLIGCTGGYNLTRLSIISQYVYDKGLSFVIYTDDPRYPSSQWLENAKNIYGDSFLGIYYLDELGGKQIDQHDDPIVSAANFNVSSDNYTAVADTYVSRVNYYLRSGPYAIAHFFSNPTEFELFTSDYALYWYDYEAGYNTVFAEFGWNYSRQLNVDLIRGAATPQNKTWGVIITWTYTQPPYLENSTQLYSDLVLAYVNGATYITIFDSDQSYTNSVLTQDQLNAMKQFWQYVQANPRTPSPVSDRTAYVLPADYGYGFRGPQDRIWGLWPNDSLTYNILDGLNMVMKEYGSNLDIVYPDGGQPVESAGYQNLIYWNEPAFLSVSPSPNSPQNGFLPFNAATVSITAIAAAIIVAVSLTFLKFRKRWQFRSKFKFPQIT